MSPAKKLINKIDGMSEDSGLETTLRNIASESGRTFGEIKARFVEIEKGVMRTVKDKSKAIAIALKSIKKQFIPTK